MKSLVSIFLILLVTVNCSIYDQYYAQARKIAQSMTIQQKIGQTIQANIEGITEKEVTTPSDATKMFLGSLLISGNAAPTTDGNLAKLASYLEEEKNKQIYLQATADNWKKLTDRLMDVSVNVTTKDNKKYAIKLLLGTDAVHGDQHSIGSVIFPHNIGLSCTHNSGNFQNLGFWTKEGVKKSGFNYAFAPCVATSHSPQWGRFYETMGQEDDFIQSYAQSFVKGLQDVSDGKIRGTLGSAKHFFGDGATRYGANQGSATVLNFENFLTHNVRGYIGSISSNVGSVMVSYSAINFIPNSYNSAYLLGMLRDDISFRGFTISDYDEVIRTETMNLPRTFMNLTQDKGYALILNAGVDMIMLSAQKQLLQTQLERIIKEAKQVVKKQLLFEDRLTEAVTHVLQVKMAMNLVKDLSEPETLSQSVVEFPQTSSTNEYQDSLTAVHQSLVVLKNSNLLPVTSLTSEIKYVVLVGEQILNINRLTKIQLFRKFDNIGMQCGGWTVRWQGFEGNDFWQGSNKASSNASSILDALNSLKNKGNNFQLIYPNYTSMTSEVTIDEERRKYIDNLKGLRKSMTPKNTLMIGVFGEVPYAESEGDVNIPYCKIQDSTSCLYDEFLNPYVSGEQKKDLTIQFTKFESEVINEVRGNDKTIPLVSVLLTGRPTPIKDIYETSTAVIAAWLPGTSGGQGIIDAISGDYVVRKGGSSNRANSLSVDWPRSMNGLDDFPIYQTDGAIPKIPDIQFPVGFGLSTESNSHVQLKQE